MTHQGSGQCPCNVSGPIWSSLLVSEKLMESRPLRQT